MPAGRAVVLLSGGLDSATTLAVARAEGFDVYALTVRYGQRHGIEVEAARNIASAMRVERHLIADVDLRAIGGSALTGDSPVPKGRSAREIGVGVPVTYVPARNSVLLSLALAWAEVIGADVIFIGVNALDYSGYPDCRAEFIAAFERMANLATRAAVERGHRFSVRAPLIDMRKKEIIALGTELGVDFAATVSCYDPSPGGEACAACDACQLRRRGFAEAGVADPTRYAPVARDVP